MRIYRLSWPTTGLPSPAATPLVPPLFFSPWLYTSAEGQDAFSGLVQSLVTLGIIHPQFNAVRREDLLAARENPDRYRWLTIRMAGHTAYFAELAPDLQDQIIARDTHTRV